MFVSSFFSFISNKVNLHCIVTVVRNVLLEVSFVQIISVSSVIITLLM